jgi:signal transduction histidine kinase
MVDVDVPETLSPVMGNRRAVEQVVLNLLSNADKYGNSDGAIKVSADRSGDYVLVSVDNPGPPLDPDEFVHVFEPFFRGPASAASAPGVGLGLTVCHRLVTAQGGRMGAIALPGGGASFRFSLLAVNLDED